MNDAEILRAELETALDDVIAMRGRTSPLAQILAHALLRGDPKPTEEKPKPGDTDVMAAINRRMQAKLAGDDE